ncbi:hypothetical protein ACTRW9_11230 [Nitrospina sp. 32_T5]|uniref:hypothetical protein n=1 Tax=unclassified Nitrospina TaxID=2638683 RepID=UPI003F9D1829
MAGKKMKEYEKIGNFPNAWINIAKNLLISAGILKDAFDDAVSNLKGPESNKNFEIFSSTFMSHLMLRAFALECLYKAIWLTQGNELYDNGSFKGIDGYKGHNLEKVAQGVSLYDNLNDVQKRVLSVLSQFNERGRYPVLNKPKDVQKLLGWCVSNHDPAFDEIVAMLYSELGIS